MPVAVQTMLVRAGRADRPFLMIHNVKFFVRSKVRALVQHGLPRAFFLGNRRNSVAVLMYHEVLEDEQGADAWTVVRASEFQKQMKHLKSHYDVISLDAVLCLMKNGGKSKGRFAVVTFDDGYAGNLRVALPVMADLNLPFTVFCPTKPIEQGEVYWWDQVICSVTARKTKLNLSEMLPRAYDFDPNLRGESRWNEIQRLLTDLKTLEPERRGRIVHAITQQAGALQRCHMIQPMSPGQVRELADSGLATIGAHSHTHDILTQLTPEEAEDSILRSKEKIEAWTGRRVDYFSYPNGDYSPALMRVVERAGFLAAVSTEERVWRRADDVYAIPRIGIGRFDSMSLFRAKVSWTN